ncbi:MAG: tetratricopeptide repeat protein [Deltaproteobacteria bacterium]|nr:tetratricopeptide repeat protein [Deltaproteobacteria bacterium]
MGPTDQLDEELRDVKREIIESRGLIIKTNNLTNALAADLKSIGKRQGAFERRAFWNSAAGSVLLVLVVIVAVKFAWDARIESVQGETRRLKESVAQLREELEGRQRLEEARAKGEAAAAAFYELCRAGKDKEIIGAYESVRKERLSRAEQAFFRDAVERSRSELSLAAYHAGLESSREGRWHEAVLALEESLRHQDAASHGPSARLLLAKGYRQLNRQREAIPILVKLAEASADPEVLDDAQFLLAECLIDIQAWNEAKATLRAFVRRFPQSAFLNDARMALAELTTKH